MMVFRRVYWVVEHVTAAGCELKGVFTSIQDLQEAFGESLKGGTYRLSLVKLDAKEGVLATWSGPDYSGMESGLSPFIETGEFGKDVCHELCDAVGAK
jgi:hypothetical protein